MAYLTDTLTHKGIHERYNVGTPSEYDEWMSDDNATDDFEATQNHFGAVDREKDKARDRAEKEYNRRKKINSRISANERGIAANRGLIDGLTMNENGQDAPVGSDEIEFSSKVSSAKKGVDAYDSMLSGAQAGSFFDSYKANVKDAIGESGITTRGEGSGINGNGFGYISGEGGGKSTFDYEKPSLGPDQEASQFFSDYKFNIAGQLSPGSGRSSAIQADKDAQLAHQKAQQPFADVPNTYVMQPGGYQ